jgi:hypothetical protein
MIEDKKLWKELIRLHCVEGQPTQAVLTQTRMGVFFIRCLIQFLRCFFFRNRLRTSAGHLANRRAPQFEKQWLRMYCLKCVYMTKRLPIETGYSGVRSGLTLVQDGFEWPHPFGTLLAQVVCGYEFGCVAYTDKINLICIWASLGVDKQCQMTVFTQWINKTFVATQYTTWIHRVRHCEWSTPVHEPT